MNKKVIITGLIVLLIILAIIVFFVVRGGSKNTLNESGINKFYYFTGSGSVNSNYTINKDQGIEFQYFNCGKEKEKKKNLSSKQMKTVYDMIEKYNINSWNGYKKHDDSDGGHSFKIEIEYQDGKRITVEGTNYFPNNYIEFQKEFQEFADGISNIKAIDIR